MILDFWPPELSELKTAALSDLVYGVLLQWPLGLVQPDQQAVRAGTRPGDRVHRQGWAAVSWAGACAAGKPHGEAAGHPR